MLGVESCVTVPVASVDVVVADVAADVAGTVVATVDGAAADSGTVVLTGVVTGGPPSSRSTSVLTKAAAVPAASTPVTDRIIAIRAFIVCSIRIRREGPVLRGASVVPPNAPATDRTLGLTSPGLFRSSSKKHPRSSPERLNSSGPVGRTARMGS